MTGAYPPRLSEPVSGASWPVSDRPSRHSGRKRIEARGLQGVLNAT